MQEKRAGVAYRDSGGPYVNNIGVHDGIRFPHEGFEVREVGPVSRKSGQSPRRGWRVWGQRNNVFSEYLGLPGVIS